MQKWLIHDRILFCIGSLIQTESQESLEHGLEGIQRNRSIPTGRDNKIGSPLQFSFIRQLTSEFFQAASCKVLFLPGDNISLWIY